MSIPKKVDLLKKKEPPAELTPEQKAAIEKDAADKRADEIINRYKPREDEYKAVGEERAKQDQQRKSGWDKLNTTPFKTSLFISLRDNEDYEILKRATRGTLRLGYRHVFKFGLKALLSLEPEAAIEKIVAIDNEYKRQGLTMKE